MKNSEIASIKTSFNLKKITSSTVFEVTEVWKASVIEARWVPPIGGFGREPPVGGCILEGLCWGPIQVGGVGRVLGTNR